MPEIEKEKLTRERWWHEDALINHRLTWLLTAQIALFAGYGWIIEKVTLTVISLTRPYICSCLSCEHYFSYKKASKDCHKIS